MFLTKVGLDSYLRCQRNIRDLEEFLNKPTGACFDT